VKRGEGGGNYQRIFKDATERIKSRFSERAKLENSFHDEQAVRKRKKERESVT